MRRDRQDLVCPLSLAKGAVHGQGTGQGTSLESSGATGLAVGQQESLGMETQGLWWLRLHTLGTVRAAGTQSQLQAFLGICPLPSPHQTAAAAGAVAARTHPEVSRACSIGQHNKQPGLLPTFSSNQEPAAQRPLWHLTRLVTPEAAPARFYLSSLQLPSCTHVQPTH